MCQIAHAMRRWSSYEEEVANMPNGGLGNQERYLHSLLSPFLNFKKSAFLECVAELNGINPLASSKERKNLERMGECKRHMWKPQYRIRLSMWLLFVWDNQQGLNLFFENEILLFF